MKSPPLHDLNTFAVVQRENAMKGVNSLLGEALMVGGAAAVGFTVYPATLVGLAFAAVAGVSCAGALTNWTAARRFRKGVRWFLPSTSSFRLEKHQNLCKKSLIKLSAQTARHNSVLHTARGLAFIGSGVAVASVGNFVVAPFLVAWGAKGLFSATQAVGTQRQCHTHLLALVTPPTPDEHRVEGEGHLPDLAFSSKPGTSTSPSTEPILSPSLSRDVVAPRKRLTI